MTSPSEQPARPAPEEGGRAPIEETVPAPPPAPVVRPGAPTPADTVRGRLAYGLGILLAVVVLLPAVRWTVADVTVNDLQNYALILSPVTGLLGIALGYYFSGGRRAAS